MKNAFSIISSLIFFASLNGQVPPGTWSDHLRYNTIRCMAVTPERVYASNGASLLVFDKNTSALSSLSKVNGLTETGISSISWSSDYEMLIIAYSTANLDIVRNNVIYNIPDIYLKSFSESITVNKIITEGRYAYLCTNIGVVLVDLVRREIRDTWHPGPGSDNNEVFDLAFGNGQVYAATRHGVWHADPSDMGLAYFGNWNLLDNLPEPEAEYNLLIFSGNRLYVNMPESSGDMVYAVDNQATLFYSLAGKQNRSFDKAPLGFTVSSDSDLRYFSYNGTLLSAISSYGWGVPNISQGIADNEIIWLADLNYGLIMRTKAGETTTLSIPGPASDLAESITSSDGRTIICAGGVNNYWNSLGRPFQVSLNENGQFRNFISGTIHDAMRSCFDPGNSSHFFVSTWGDGLIEYNNDEQVMHYDHTNSPLRGTDAGGESAMICGLAFDRAKNLWITQSGVSGSIKILNHDGTWVSYPLSLNVPLLGDIISTGTGQKWIILPAGNGLLEIDDNNTPEIFTDDKYKILNIRDDDGNVISQAYSIAEDLDGNIWVGTNQGPVIYFSTSRITDDDLRGYRIKVPRNDGSGLADYMLGTETITSIAVDGANRKWIGTSGSGVYLLSSDGTRMIKNYTSLNSPLFSNSVTSLAVDNKTGELWIGTSKGIESVRETATAGGNEFGKVYSYPNPVRENFEGNVTITGLIRDTRIKITDVSGNLVYETVSEGGQAVWDLSTYNGKRVTTGVYLVFCSADNGSRSCITKILVISR